jgi:SAM-dependent methyltransferase
VTDLPFGFAADLAAPLARAFDADGKLPRALEALGPIGGRETLLIGDATGRRLTGLEERPGPLRQIGELDAAADIEAESLDVVVAAWPSFEGPPADAFAEAERVLRPGGRELIVLDYGRDDLAALRGEEALAEAVTWSRRDGPFLGNGFRIRVIHCWLTFPTVDQAGAFLDAAFGERGQAAAGRLTRPRLSSNVAIYHRTVGASG